MFEVKFSIDNDAFQNGNGRKETANILKTISNKVLNGDNEGTIMDSNGNVVGKWRVR